MFNPSEREKAKAALKEKKAQTAKVSELASQLIPLDIQEGLLIDVKEVQCGDPVSYTYLTSRLLNSV
jgi:hypothetical protein